MLCELFGTILVGSGHEYEELVAAVSDCTVFVAYGRSDQAACESDQVVACLVAKVVVDLFEVVHIDDYAGKIGV